MATRTVSLSEEAYSRLAALKRESESFSDVVNRITGKFALRSLAGILAKKDADAIDSGRKDVNRRMRQKIDRVAKDFE